MNSSNKHSQPFFTLLTVAVILVVLSCFDTNFYLFNYKSKSIDPLGDILVKGTLKHVPLSEPIINDSIISKDSLAYASRQIDPANIVDFDNDSVSALTNFFEALNQLKVKKRKVRIAYFGDSMIEGDLITQDFRECLQDVFGGNGVGYVPVTSVVSGFRTSIIHQFAGFTTHHLLENSSDNTLGISGYSFVPYTSNTIDTSANSGSSSWVKYVGVNRKHLSSFNEVKLLYGKSQGENYVSLNGFMYPLKGDQVVNQLSVKLGNNCKQLNAQFKCKTLFPVYGFSIESDSGVFVDNFSFRGNSGLPISKVSQAVYEGTDACLNYDLIILEYGLNAVSPNVTDFSWYEIGMNKTIKHIQKSFPHSSILLISVGDKSYRKDGVYQTDPSVPILVATQKKMAKENGLAFWSLYDAMGGNGAMVHWVQGDTVFANKDYTHFNFKGAHKVGKLLFTKIMSEYADYNKKNKKNSPTLPEGERAIVEKK